MQEVQEPAPGESVFFVPFFNLFYYFSLVPFKVEFDRKKNRYYFKRFKLQSALCALSHLMVLSLMVVPCLVVLPDVGENEHTILIAFDIIRNLTTIVSGIIIVRILWNKHDSLLQVIECGRVNDFKMKKVAFFIYGVIMSVMILMGFVHFTSIEESTELDRSLTMAPYSALQKLKKILNANGLDTINQIVSVVFPGLFMFTGAFYLTCQGIFVMIGLVMRQLAKEFALDMEVSWKIADMSKGIRHYRELKRKTDFIRDLFGNHLLAFYATSISYYAEAPHVMLRKRGSMEKTILIYFILTGGIWLLAAEFHHQVKSSALTWNKRFTDSQWLHCEDRLKLLAFSSEIVADPIALATKYFPVTYRHIGSMVGLIVTYGIIVFQLYHPEPHGPKKE